MASPLDNIDDSRDSINIDIKVIHKIEIRENRRDICKWELEVQGENMEETRPKFIFTCQRCGRWCKRDINIYLNDVERWSKDGTFSRVFPMLSVSGEPMALSLHLVRENGKCKMYDLASKECTIYNNRPIVCRAYPLMTMVAAFS